MMSLQSKKTLNEIIRAKMNVIEKERESFYRFRALLAHLDYDVYRKVMKEFTPEVKEASNEEFLKMLDDIDDRQQDKERYRGWHR